MAFWGVEVKPSRPYSHNFDGRLRISQATLGNGTSTKKSLVQCNVEDKTSVYICCLLPDKVESCSLDLEFQGEDKVTFSVLGPRSVHLAGYYLDGPPNTDDTDSYGEDIGETESEHSNDLESEDEYEDDFIDDADLETFSPSPIPKNGAEVGEVVEDEEQAERKGNPKRLRKKYQVSDSDGDSKKENIVGGGPSIFVSDSDSGGDNRKENIIGGGSSIFVSDSEDNDSLPISSLSKAKIASAEVQEQPDATAVEKNKKRHVHVTGSKRKREYVQDDETERASEKPNNVCLPSSGVGEENAEKPKKKKKKVKSKEQKNPGEGSHSVMDVQDDKAQMEETKTDDFTKEHICNETDEKPSRSLEPDVNHVEEGTVEKRKKRKKKKKNKTAECDQIVNTGETTEAKKTPEIVEEVAMVTSGNKRAAGKKGRDRGDGK